MLNVVTRLCHLWKPRLTIQVFCGKEIMVNLDWGRFTMGWAQTSWQKCKDTKLGSNYSALSCGKHSDKLLATRPSINKLQCNKTFLTRQSLIRTSKCLFEVGHGIPASWYFAADWAGGTDSISQICIAELYCRNDGQCTIENSTGQPHSQLDWRLYFYTKCAASTTKSSASERRLAEVQLHSAVISWQ